MSIESGVEAGMIKMVAYFVDKMKDTLNAGEYPTGNDEHRPNYIPIQDSIEIGVPVSQGDTVSLTVTVGGENAPYAHAYEFGSGEHATQGPKGTYPIVPREADVLAIPRSRWPKYDGRFGNIDPVFLMRVDHPGVAAKPYIKPTLEREQGEMRRILGQEFKAAIISRMRRIEAIK